MFGTYPPNILKLQRPRILDKVAVCIEELERVQDQMQDLYSSGAVEGYSNAYLAYIEQGS